MTIHPGEREGSTSAAPLENIAPTSPPLSGTPAIEVQPLNIDSGNLYSNTAEPAPPAADSNTTASSGDVPQDVVPSDEPAVPSAPLDVCGEEVVNRDRAPAQGIGNSAHNFVHDDANSAPVVGGFMEGELSSLRSASF